MTQFYPAKPVFRLRRGESLVPGYDRNRDERFQLFDKIEHPLRRGTDRIIHIDRQANHDLFRFLLEGELCESGGIVAVVLPLINRESEGDLFGRIRDGQADPLLSVAGRSCSAR